MRPDFALWEAELAPSLLGRWSAAVRRFLHDSMIGLGRCYAPISAHESPRSSQVGPQPQGGVGPRTDGVDAGSELDEF